MKFFVNFLFFISIAYSSLAFAGVGDFFSRDDGKNELHVSTTQGSLTFGSETTHFDVSGGYMRQIESRIIVGGDVGIGSYSYDGFRSSHVSIYGLGHFLLNDAPAHEAYFALGGLGLGSTISKYYSRDDNNLGFRLGAGRRLKIARQLLWRPEIFFEQVADYDGLLVIKFLNLTYFW
jgi:hypothetical protein